MNPGGVADWGEEGGWKIEGGKDGRGRRSRKRLCLTRFDTGYGKARQAEGGWVGDGDGRGIVPDGSK
jgi:hypothetical protein